MAKGTWFEGLKYAEEVLCRINSGEKILPHLDDIESAKDVSLAMNSVRGMYRRLKSTSWLKGYCDYMKFKELKVDCD